MRLKSIAIKNFRCLTEFETVFEPMTSFIGPNNAGKSTILRAIELLLNKRPVITLNDVSASPIDNELRICGTFGDLSEKELVIFRDHLSDEPAIEIALHAEFGENETVQTSVKRIATFSSERFWFLNSTANGRLSSGAKVKQEHGIADDPLLISFLGNDLKSARSIEQIKLFQDNWRKQNPTEDLAMKKVWSDLPKTGPLIDNLPTVQFLPAELKIDDDASLKSGSIFSRLTKLLMAEMEKGFYGVQQGIQAAIDSLDTQEFSSVKVSVEQAISDELSSWGTTAQIRINTPDAEAILEKAFELHFDDGVSSSPTSKGHGLQRASFFALTRALEKLQRKAGSEMTNEKSLVLLVEEPELYLHPHAQRQLRLSLSNLSAAVNTQVILATHSPHFVNFSNAKEIRRISRADTRRLVHHIPLDSNINDMPPKQKHNMDYWLNPHRNEMFFAEFVILVEGQTESVVVPTVCETLGIDTTNFTVLDANGKNNLIQYIQILNAFGIPYVVIHDEDPVKDRSQYSNGDKYKSELDTFHLNVEISESVSNAIGRCVVVRPDFEGMFNVTKAEVKEFGKGLAAQRRMNRYLETVPLDFPTGIHEVTRAIESLLVPGQADEDIS